MDDRHLGAARDPERFRSLGHAVVDRLAEYLAAAGERAIPVSRPVAPEGMAERWPADFPGGADPLALVERILAESVVTHHPGYVGHQLAAPLPLTTLGTLVAAVTNGSGAIYELSQSSSACEAALAQYLSRAARSARDGRRHDRARRHASRRSRPCWPRARRRPASTSGATARTPVRRSRCSRSDQTHYSTSRAAQIMGFGEGGAIAVETDERFRMRPEALAAEIAAARDRGLRPIAVVATAGTTSTGAFDPLDAIADICAAEGLWLHVDAAHGGSAALSPALAPQLAGIERADSVVWDLHKTLPFPALASLLAYARARDAYGAFAAEGRLPLPQRRPRRREHGHAHARVHAPAARGRGLPRVRDRRVPMACARTSSGSGSSGRELAGLVRESGDFELALEPECNIVCFRHRAPAGVDADAHQERIRGELNASGSYYLVQTRLRGSTWLRSALMNAATTRDDLLGMLAALRAAAARDLTRAAAGAARPSSGGQLGEPAHALARDTPDGGRCDRRARRAVRCAIAPSMSSERLSPTITASSGGAPPSASAAAKIVAHGLRRPCAWEASAKSTPIPSCAANSSSSRSVFETRPTVQGLARRTSSSGSYVGEELEVARIAPLLLGGDADLLGRRARRSHAAHDLGREAAVLGAAVLERLDLPDVERSLARRLVALRVEPDAEARAELRVAIRVEHAVRADQREVDVEQNELRRPVHRPGP